MGPGSLQSPITSSFLLLILLLPGPLLPPQLGGYRGLYSLQVSGHTHRDYPRGDQGAWGNSNRIILLLEDSRTFLLLSIFLVKKGRKDGKKKARKGKEGKEKGKESALVFT